MIPYTPADGQRPNGGRLNGVIRNFETALVALVSEYRTLTEAIDRADDQTPPDPNSRTAFSFIASAWGYPTSEEAQRAYKQVEAVAGRLTTDAPIDGMESAIRQMLARLKG